ncbi:hypothetical protein AMECASPLE_012861 [Ameca splendens]|uniref:Secreted protein n=1 Tax=Ameca splendens TaxID=208324 RepID=A0ABV0XQ36_9TELE
MQCSTFSFFFNLSVVINNVYASKVWENVTACFKGTLRQIEVKSCTQTLTHLHKRVAVMNWLCTTSPLSFIHVSHWHGNRQHRRSLLPSSFSAQTIPLNSLSILSKIC